MYPADQSSYHEDNQSIVAIGQMSGARLAWPQGFDSRTMRPIGEHGIVFLTPRDI